MLLIVDCLLEFREGNCLVSTFWALSKSINVTILRNGEGTTVWDTILLSNVRTQFNLCWERSSSGREFSLYTSAVKVLSRVFDPRRTLSDFKAAIFNTGSMNFVASGWQEFSLVKEWKLRGWIVSLPPFFLGTQSWNDLEKSDISLSVSSDPITWSFSLPVGLLKHRPRAASLEAVTFLSFTLKSVTEVLLPPIESSQNVFSDSIGCKPLKTNKSRSELYGISASRLASNLAGSRGTIAEYKVSLKETQKRYHNNKHMHGWL